jgi:Asp-tRNA(Asn)/Glu-tRNA(Gln) amidotransferase B subunit
MNKIDYVENAKYYCESEEEVELLCNIIVMIVNKNSNYFESENNILPFTLYKLVHFILWNDIQNVFTLDYFVDKILLHNNDFAAIISEINNLGLIRCDGYNNYEILELLDNIILELIYNNLTCGDIHEYYVSQLMRKLQGKANPKVVTNLVKKYLKK